MTLYSGPTDWLDKVALAFAANQLIKISLTKPTPMALDLKSVDVRPIMIKRVLNLSFTYHYKTRDIVKNYDLSETLSRLSALLADIFLNARLCTTLHDVSLLRRDDAFDVVSSKPTMQHVDMAHNRAKQHLISSGGKPYLHALGLTDKTGQILKTSQDKFRQINKYIEIVDGLIKHLPAQTLRIVDMGAGKGYLTFALYDHITNTLRRDCAVTGVESRSDLVSFCNEIAAASEFSGLNFVEGSISSFECAGFDVVIALHACDTATDDAIAKAISAEADIIVVAPCCHKHIRRQMKSSDKAKNLEFLLRFGTYQERLAEMITDGLRAQFMELSGYQCNLFEFISDAHTPKNVMIVGKKLTIPRSADATRQIADDIALAKQTFGIGAHYLELLLPPSVGQ
jgi:SAM-dependent methyltransferase